MPLSDYAARAAMLQREVEALARMSDQGGGPTDHDALTSISLIPRSSSGQAGGGLPWLSGMLPGPSSAPSAPQRRDLSRERAERRALSAPIPPRNRSRAGAAAGVSERSRAARVSLNDSTGSTPSNPTPPKTPGSEGGDNGHPREGGTSDAAELPPAPGADCASQSQSQRLGDMAVDRLEDGRLNGEREGLANVRWTNDEWCHRLERKKTAAERAADVQSAERGGSEWSERGGSDHWSELAEAHCEAPSPLNLSKCVSLLDDNDLAGLAAAEAAFVQQERAKRLLLQVQQAASNQHLSSIDRGPQGAASSGHTDTYGDTYGDAYGDAYADNYADAPRLPSAAIRHVEPHVSVPVPRGLLPPPAQGSPSRASPSPFFGVELSMD